MSILRDIGLATLLAFCWVGLAYVLASLGDGNADRALLSMLVGIVAYNHVTTKRR